MQNTKLRVDAFYQLRELVEKLKPIYKSCLNCENFNEEKEICKKYNQRPPARVIAYACKDWDDLEIPF